VGYVRSLIKKLRNSHGNCVDSLLEGPDIGIGDKLVPVKGSLPHRGWAARSIVTSKTVHMDLGSGRL
jgi:hypothetical protein